ncbi:N-acetylmuramoyl-L-alanine amidase CwlD [Salinibacillus xinjiangensis]|uniref:N-acetylmuramoyl-L-alanine amidase CwlD n=1 Tax=Salinibacillus xinjiangensis TaxID=1229268 RepID=A0A6G1XAQ6_9BACI|nr:N-acetylmuramoyl-L-alanine amidase CwlD [Salinibacillus xinjiangensis]MRG88064.1 N-acetylmuramoyl-L-alanine amidase CwlD [Salinibacillus xinjiangensis]
MKRKLGFSVLWLIGLAVLIFLLQYPVTTKEAWESWSLPLSGKVIVLDPGHGGVDGGAVGSDETLEKDIALSTVEKLRDYLQEAGALVYLTREDDRDLAAEGTKGLSKRKVEDIRKRVQFIQDKEPDLFLSIHLNAIPSSKWSGAQTFYYPAVGKSEHLAKFIQSEIRRNLDNTTRKAQAIKNVYILKHAKSPGALVEIGFLSNPHERDLLKTTDYQLKMAGSIYEGILRYITEEEYPEES